MKKNRLIFALFLIIVIITGCEDKGSNRELQRQVRELEQQIEILQIENKNFPQIINNTLAFIEAVKIKDIKTLKNMFSEEYELIEQNNQLFVKKTDSSFLWQLDLVGQHQGLTLQSYVYDAEKDDFFIQIRLLYYDSSGNIVTPPTFVYLTYNRNWKVIGIEFDV